MAVNPRCEIAADNGNSSTVLNTGAIALTGWTNSGAGPAGTAPAAGDLVVIIICIFNATQTANQASGTGTWTFQATGDDNGSAATDHTSAVAWRVFDGTETAPTFAWGTASRYSYSIMALAPDAGKTLSPDVWAAVVKVTTAATTATAGAATGSGGPDCSLVLITCATNVVSGSAITYTAPASWTIPTLGSDSNTGTGSKHGCGSSIAYRAGQTGTVTPGAETFSQACYSNAYQLLVQEPGGAANVFNRQQAVMTAATR